MEVTQRDHGVSLGSPVSGIDSKNHFGRSQPLKELDAISITTCSTPEKKIPLPFKWLVLNDELNEQKMAIFPLKQRAKWTTGCGLSTFSVKEWDTFQQVFPMFSFREGLRHLEWNSQPIPTYLHPNLQEEMKTPEEGTIKRVDYHRGKHEPQRNVPKTKHGFGAVFVVDQRVIPPFWNDLETTMQFEDVSCWFFAVGDGFTHSI